MAEVTNIYDSPYTRQKEQNWQIPDPAAEEKHLGLNSRDTKAKIFEAYQWLVEMYYKVRHDAKQTLNEERIAHRKETSRLETEIARLRENQGNNFLKEPIIHTEVQKEGVPVWVSGLLVVAGLILGTVVGVAYIN